MSRSPAALARAGDVPARDPLRRRARRRAVRPGLPLRRRRREGREPSAITSSGSRTSGRCSRTRRSCAPCATRFVFTICVPGSRARRRERSSRWRSRNAFPGARAVRFLILLPWVAPVSIGSIGWKWILDSALQRHQLGRSIRLHLANPVLAADVAGRAEARDAVGDPRPHLAHAAVRDRDPARRDGRRFRRTFRKRRRSTARASSGGSSRSRFR